MNPSFRLSISLALSGALLVSACGDNGSAPAEDATDDATDTDAATDPASDAVVDADSDADSAADPDGTTDGSGAGDALDTADAGPPAPVEPPPIYTPRWAFEPWISKDISDTDDTYAFVEGFRERDIPVGVVVLDSPWETNYNTFIPNPTRYHDFEQLVADLHADDIRIVLWVTQFVNEISFDLETGGDVYTSASALFAEGIAEGYFVNDGETYSWWKGFGASVDFFDPWAVAWWHAQQDPLLDLGINGWKLDFGDSYITTPEIETEAGTVTHQEYSEAYYRDFFAYGAQRRGTDEFVTMVRPWDESYGFEGRFYARPEHAPVAWVGDQRRDWVGLADALDHIFRSAKAGYVMLGSDIGGYLDRDDVSLGDTIPFDTEVFARWTAVGALNPFMQLHGRANITPWTVPDRTEEIVEIYRYWATLHHQMVPFFDTLARQTYALGTEPIIRPQGDEADWAGDYSYTLGNSLFVAPILGPEGVRDVSLPPLYAWYDWWSDDPVAIDGQVLPAVDATDLGRIPLYVREGAIIPLQDATEVTGLGTTASRDAATLLVYPPRSAEFFQMFDDEGRDWWLEATNHTESCALRFTRLPDTTYVRALWRGPSDAVDADGVALDRQASREDLDAVAEGWAHVDGTPWVWIKLSASEEQTIVTIR
ncbi:MAG: glycoside hydrolase family 31 protein [Myxococcales bacterium]|nr:glycoside hydrolase family 31 protein [Myxococcales bacterium]MCB9531452.1 glycoside hydrolase family 31 protein [Myxococcales bacterium]MCB9534037.1 glycoside hydrolase family 31 protein [Myxococcales bacterium]